MSECNNWMANINHNNKKSFSLGAGSEVEAKNEKDPSTFPLCNSPFKYFFAIDDKCYSGISNHIVA